jgi:serine/threonine protein kinase/tetratricopeptide (TPR) repeat protein
MAHECFTTGSCDLEDPRLAQRILRGGQADFSRRDPKECKMIGQVISHYKIIEKLGEGGMGVVYKAEDTKLKRTVALKFLPHHATAGEAERARFLQEAQAAAILNHANICTIYAVEEDLGQTFIAMEYIDGMTLRQKIAAAMPMRDAIGYAVQIAEALEEAHSKGIVHRDIKADNVMVNGKNLVKVMDFGLAKLKGSLKLTKTSSTVGTLAYMAPEQIQGGEVDHRSDIFSFGVLLFEMLTGKLPFRGEHEAAMVYSIVNEEAESLTTYLPDAAPELLHIVNRALEKDPEDRYQSAHEMSIDLRRLRKDTTRVLRSRPDVPIVRPPTVPVPTETREAATSAASIVGSGQPKSRIRSLIVAASVVLVLGVAVAGYFLFRGEPDTGARLPIAVADFVNQTKEEELDGLSGMLITSLEQSRKLAVVTRSRMYDILKQMGRTDIERIDEALGREICREAGVSSLVVASIRKFDQLYIIDLKVLDPIKNEYVLTAKEEGQGKSSIPSMIDKLSERTRLGLREQRDDVRAASARIADVTTTNLEAYQHYFRGEQLINKLEFDAAAKSFQQAVAIDTTFALAYFRMAYAYNWNGNPGARDAITRAMQYIDRAPEKDRPLIRAIDALVSEDVQRALGIYREYLTIYPDNKEAIYEIGDYSFHLQDYPTAAAHLQRVISMDPTFERAYQHLCWTYQLTQQFAEGLRIARQYVAKSPDVESYNLLADAFLNQAQYDSAIRVYRQGLGAFPNNRTLQRNLALTYLFSNDVASCQAELSNLLQPDRELQDQLAGSLAMIWTSAYRGRYREALDWNQKTIDVRERQNDRSGLAQAYAARAFLSIDLLGDTTSGRAALQKALEYQREGDSQYSITLFSVYLQLGEFERARSIGKQRMGLIFPKYPYEVDARANASSGNLPAAITNFRALQPEIAGLADRDLYGLGKAYLENGQPDRAVATLQKIHQGLSLLFNGPPDRAFLHGRSLVLLGQAYEKVGEPKKAIEQYEKLLRLWKDADGDIPVYVDAKARLAKLKALARG